MPQRPKRPCRQPGCPNLTDNGACELHTRATAAKQYDDRRGSSSSRGYDARWQRFRAYYLRLNPLCVDCVEQGRYAAARDVHHVKKLRDRPDLQYDEGNLKPLCGACHKARTARGE